MEADSWLTSQPIAHRGLYDEADGRAENSLAAFRCAVEHGIPFELDVQLTSDRHAVVVHDRDLLRVTGHSEIVSRCDLAKLGRLRIMSNGERIPTLGQVLEVVDGLVPIVIDIRKWKLGLDSDLEHVVLDHVRGYRGPVALQSFDPLVVLHLRRTTPDFPLGQISGALRSANTMFRLIGRSMVSNFLTRPDYLSCELSELPSATVNYWRRKNCPLVAFTVHCEEEEQLAFELADNFFFSGFLPRIYKDRGL